MISVIIPALNEAPHITQTLHSLNSIKDLEVILVDGGSKDRTVTLGKAFGIRILNSYRGRGLQMNKGATEAKGDILLFLHADTRLPEEFFSSIQEILSRPGVVAGAFKLKIDLPGRVFRLLEKLVYFRSRFFQMPYGDQAIFLKRSTFKKMGGFPEYPIMEDYSLISKLKKEGRVELSDHSVETSGRRWEKKGVIKTTIMNQVIILGYTLGVSPQTLADWYRH